MIGMTVCSGIGAPELSAPWIDWKYQSEIEPFPAAVLAHRFPDAINLGDMTKFEEWPDANVDVLCGGTPCQSFSVAGLRRGLADPRGNLMLTYLAIARRYQPKWLVWENVPGVLSSNGGRDFGALLRGLGELGYGFAYRVLDAQYVRTCGFEFAVPQRRRRVFVVGYLGDWRRAAAVLFDGESLSGNPPPRREAGQGTSHAVAPSLTSSGRGVERGGDSRGQDPVIAQPVAPTLNAHFGDKMGLENQHINQGGGCSLPPVSMSLNAHGARLDAESETLLPTTGGGFEVAHSLKGEGFDASEDGTGRGTPIVPVVTDTLVSNGDAHSGFRDEKGLVPVAIQERAVSENPDNGPDGMGVRDDGASYTLEARTTSQAVAFAQNQRGELRTSEVSPQPTTGGGKPGEGYPAVLQDMEIRNADAYEADASSVLSELRKAVGEEAFQQWGLGVLAALQSQEVLRSWMHGASLRGSEDIEKSKLVDLTPPSEGSCSARRLLHQVWEEGPDGRTPQGRGLAKQLAGQPGEALSVLPPRCSQEDRDVQLVQRAREGARLLREALSEMEKVGRSSGGQGKPTYTAWKVRRLTPTEAHRLQGFPDDWCRIPWRNKPAGQCPDGPQYKCLGNSWAINCGEWIFDRIKMVEAAA